MAGRISVHMEFDTMAEALAGISQLGSAVNVRRFSPVPTVDEVVKESAQALETAGDAVAKTTLAPEAPTTRRTRRTPKSETPADEKATEETAGVAASFAAEVEAAAEEAPAPAEEPSIDDAPKAEAPKAEAPKGAAPAISKEEAERRYAEEIRPATTAIMGAMGQDGARDLIGEFLASNGVKAEMVHIKFIPPQLFDAFLGLCREKAGDAVDKMIEKLRTKGAA